MVSFSGGNATSSHVTVLQNILQENMESGESAIPSPPSKRRKFSEQPMTGYEIDKRLLSIYVYLACVLAKQTCISKILFMVKSMKDRQQTDEIVQKIQQQVVSKLRLEGEQLVNDSKDAQLMLLLQPDKNGDWRAKSSYSERIWNFRKGDYIKIDNHHGMDVGICVHHYFIPQDDSEDQFLEDFRSPSKYPVLFPGGSLEIGLDDSREARLALAAGLDSEPSDTFAVTHNGAVATVVDKNVFDETCIFSFKVFSLHYFT